MFESCEEPIFEAEVGIACRPSSSSARAAPPADRRASRRGRSARRPPSGTCGFPLSKHVEDVKHRKVMVVEDDHLIREAIAEALDEEGFEVVEAANGREALDKRSEEHTSELQSRR